MAKYLKLATSIFFEAYEPGGDIQALSYIGSIVIRFSIHSRLSGLFEVLRNTWILLNILLHCGLSKRGYRVWGRRDGQPRGA